MEAETSEGGGESSSRRRKQAESWALVRDEMARQMEHFKKTEAENVALTREVSLLRERHGSIEVLREEKRLLENKLKATHAVADKVATLEVELAAAKRAQAEWLVFFLSNPFLFWGA